MSYPSPSSRARPLRLRLTLLAASGLLPLLLVLVWGINYLIEDRRSQSERSVVEVSRALGTAVDAELRSIMRLLDQMGASDELEREDLRSVHRAAIRAARQFNWHEVVLSDAEGRVLLRSGDPFGTSSPVPVEPDSLRRVIATRQPSVGHVFQTPGLKADAFAVRVPVLRSGKLVYVLSAVLPTDALLAVLVRQHIPSASVAAVFDQMRRLVVRSRPATSAFASPSLQLLLDRNGQQGAGLTLTQEGMESYTGYTRLEGVGWTVAVGTSVDGANEGLYALLRALAVGLAASLALSALLAWGLSRRVLEPIDALIEGAAALGRGEPVWLPPLEIVELDDVGVALAAAAAERDRSLQERERAATERERLVGQIADALRMAEEANRSKDQFLAVLGHELRNPLAPITNAMQLMQIKGDESTVRERRIIERQLAHVTRLVDDLLDVSRITSGRLSIRRAPVRLADLLEQLVESVRPSVDGRVLTLEIGPGTQDAWVSGDEVRLVQVFNNLLVNAIKFTPPAGSISVRAVLSDSGVRVDIVDSGIGIDADDIARIFELFYQSPQHSDRSRGGLGLGLPIVKNLVEMHGGTVAAESAGPGQGSKFTVLLPLVDAPASSRPAPLLASTVQAGRILVVDDNRDAADTCAALLEMSGYTVRVAYTPEASLQVLQQFRPDTAILDIGLPGMSGYALAGLMKAPPLSYRGKLIALTGYGQASDRADSSAAGFDAHLTKPVSPQELLDLVESLSSSAGSPS